MIAAVELLVDGEWVPQATASMGVLTVDEGDAAAVVKCIADLQLHRTRARRPDGAVVAEASPPTAAYERLPDGFRRWG